MMGRLLRRQWMHYTAQEEALGPPHVRITCGRGEKKNARGRWNEPQGGRARNKRITCKLSATGTRSSSATVRPGTHLVGNQTTSKVKRPSGWNGRVLPPIQTMQNKRIHQPDLADGWLHPAAVGYLMKRRHKDVDRRRSEQPKETQKEQLPPAEE